jgi:2-keto-4-pentenoate hydratase/2-oxohepta-3-ene-1,7-dioic acid hydratase in catechol pathway
MRLVTFQHQGHSHAGVVFKKQSEDQVFSLKSSGFPTVISFLDGGLEARKRAEVLLAKPPEDAVFALESVKLLAPIPKPPKIICIGLNYKDHAIESGMPIPATPTVFTKFATAVIGPGEPIVLPKSSQKPDYEAELAFVIGKGGRYIAAADWRDHVFGYMNLNDVSARDYQLATSQWTIGKTFDTFAPMGPWLVSADEIPNPHELGISLTIDGEVLQNSNTRELIFKIPDLVEYLSSVFTLEAGDIVSTGTPPGVGMARTPPRWLKAGEQVVVAIEGLGELKNPIQAE